MHAFSDIYEVRNLNWFLPHRLPLDTFGFLAGFWSLGFVCFLAGFGFVGVLVRGSVVLSVRVSVVPFQGFTLTLLRNGSSLRPYSIFLVFAPPGVGGFPPPLDFCFASRTITRFVSRLDELSAPCMAVRLWACRGFVWSGLGFASVGCLRFWVSVAGSVFAFWFGLVLAPVLVVGSVLFWVLLGFRSWGLLCFLSGCFLAGLRPLL
jgi:hypothetical protein